MRLYFDIEDEEFMDEGLMENGFDFKSFMIENMKDAVIGKYFRSDEYRNIILRCDEQIKQLIKDRSDEIVDRVVEIVSDKIAHKKALVDMTPKASEIGKLSKENEKYFCDMIDKAIAKKFK